MALASHSIIQRYALKVILLRPNENLQTGPAQGEDRGWGKQGEDPLSGMVPVYTHPVLTRSYKLDLCHIHGKEDP